MWKTDSRSDPLSCTQISHFLEVAHWLSTLWLAAGEVPSLFNALHGGDLANSQHALRPHVLPIRVGPAKSAEKTSAGTMMRGDMPPTAC